VCSAENIVRYVKAGSFEVTTLIKVYIRTPCPSSCLQYDAGTNVPEQPYRDRSHDQSFPCPMQTSLVGTVSFQEGRTIVTSYG
jgi:hypothetical protein